MAQSSPVPHGLRTFIIIWIGQFVSLIGSQLTGFALGVWIYEQTGSVTLFAVQNMAWGIPQIVFSPLAGALADRWNRRTAMMVSDTGAGVSSLIIWILLGVGFINPTNVWPIFLLTAMNSAFNSMQWPAWSAATTLLVPKEQLGRASGATQMADAAAQLLAPAIAGVLYIAIGLNGLILLDFGSFLFAVLTMLAFVRIPNIAASAEGAAGKGSFLKEVTFGWHFIRARPALLALLSYFATLNFLNGFIQPLFPPMILDQWGTQTYGFVGTGIGFGFLVGTLIMSAWGGPKRKIYGLLGAGVVGGLFIAVAGLRASLPLLMIGGFGFMLTMPIMNACSQAIWQRKTAPDVQGRVFSVRRMIAWSTGPIAMAVAGSLADAVFKPAMAEGGPLADTFVGAILGVGEARGIGLFIVVVGLLCVVISVAALAVPLIRRIETILPDAEVKLAEEDKAPLESSPTPVPATGQ